jgi:mannose-6-phosphate isomerase-like protein (cupin superfamily)
MFDKKSKDWGWHRMLDDQPQYKVKLLVINSGASLPSKQYDMQKHWFVLQGSCVIETDYLDDSQTIRVQQGHSYGLGAGVKHLARNDDEAICQILEVRYLPADES